RNAPLIGSNAWISPSPKLPTSRSLAKAPNPPGARVSPQGELRGSPVPVLMSRLMKFPFKSNTSTNPFPAPATSSCLAASCSAKVTYSCPFILLDVEGRPVLTGWCAGGNRGWVQIGKAPHKPKTGIVFFDLAAVEVRGKKKIAAANRGDRKSVIDRA